VSLPTKPAPAATPTPQPSVAEWKAIVTRFQKPSLPRALWQLVNTVGGFVLLWVLLHWSLEVSLWLTAALAVLDVIRDEGLQDNAARVSSYVAERMAALRHPLLRDTRSNGLFFGAEFILENGQPATRFCADLVEAMVASGVLMNVIGAGRNILKIRPPMPFSLENADFLMDRLEAALTSAPVPA